MQWKRRLRTPAGVALAGITLIVGMAAAAAPAAAAPRETLNTVHSQISGSWNQVQTPKPVTFKSNRKGVGTAAQLPDIYCEAIAFDPVRTTFPSIAAIGGARCTSGMTEIEVIVTLFLDSGTAEGPSDHRISPPGASSQFGRADTEPFCFPDVFGTRVVAGLTPPPDYYPEYAVIADFSSLVALTCN